MDENTQGSGTSGGQGQVDVNAVASRAKAASQGFDFNKLFIGRVDNMNYLYAAIVSFVFGFILMMVPIIGWLANIALLVLGIGMTIRRFHDINITGLAALVLLVPVINLLAVLYLCFQEGDKGANTFGPPPEAKRDFFHAVLNT